MPIPTPLLSDDTASRVASLKNEGNRLFIKGDYIRANLKYTQAIAADDLNAVLYANRAACNMALKRYGDAASDARRATFLDPKYAKGWSRLAAAYGALSQHAQSVAAWKHAIASLPTSRLSSEQKRQRKQYLASLKDAQAALAEAEASGPAELSVARNVQAKELPWHHAQKMKQELKNMGETGLHSSAWVILYAYEEFKEGVNYMNSLKKMQTPKGTSWHGNTMSLVALTNGILRDERAFHVEDPDWTQKYNNQVAFENQKWDAWVDAAPNMVIEQVQQRLIRKGWSNVRPALSTTVRAWIMRGFMESTNQNHATAIELLRNALEVLKWGFETWKDVSTSDKGMIFSWTFINGVRSLFLTALSQAIALSLEPSANLLMRELLEMAEELISDGNSLTSTDGCDPGFVLSFTVYPLANALAVKGYYYSQLAKTVKQNGEEAASHLRKSAEHYTAAADKLPEDDEYHAWFLWCALEALWLSGHPLSATLPVLARIRLALPKMSRIWQIPGQDVGSAAAALGDNKAQRDQALRLAVDFERDARAAIAQGRLTLDTVLLPEGVQWL